MRPRLLSLVAFSLTASAMTVLPPATAGDLYKWTDDKGRVQYSSVPPLLNPGKAKAVDPDSLPPLTTLPSNPSASRAEDGSTKATRSRSGESKFAATPPVDDISLQAEPTSPPVLIPPSLLPPSNPPAAAKPEQTAQSEIVEVVAQGMGIDANAALLNAYSNAVQQALGLYVDAETLVQNDQIVQDKILTYSKGFIQEATTVKQSQANGLFQVNIRAKVKRQQLLEQAKANNITVKAVEGVSLHAQVESQIKQEKDGKALLEKALLPLMGTTFHRAEIAPSTQEQPNPTINKKGTDDNFVTLDYKVKLWIEEVEYYNYIKTNLIPILNQIAIHKGELSGVYANNSDQERSRGILHLDLTGKPSYDQKKELLFSVLTWRDKGFSSGKIQWFAIPIDLAPKLDRYSSDFCEKSIELSLSSERNETIALGTELIKGRLGTELIKGRPSCFLEIGGISGYFSTSPIALTNSGGIDEIKISPSFSYFQCVRYSDGCNIKFVYSNVSVKISRADLPNVKIASVEVKPTR